LPEHRLGKALLKRKPILAGYEKGEDVFVNKASAPRVIKINRKINWERLRKN